MIRLAIVLLALRMCGDDDGDGIAADRDAGAPSFSDAAVDAAFPSDAGTLPPPFDGYPLDPSLGAESPGERDDSLDGVESCYDGLDNDAESSPGADCADPGCATLPSCWIGRDTQCGPPLAGPTFDACAEGSCFEGATLFGSPTPFVEGDTLALGGDAAYDSGLLFPTTYDLRTDVLRLSARFGLPADCSGCLESAAFGVTAARALGETDHVVPIAALVLSGARNEVALVIGTATLARFDASPGPWTLTLSPDGTASVSRDGTVVHDGARFARDASARVVLYGHSRNPSATAIASARIETFSTRSERCDMPAAWSTPETIRFERGLESWEVTAPSSPSVALDPSGVPTLVFVERGAVHAAKAPDPAAPSRFVPTAANGLDGPALVSDASEVELVANDGGFSLYVRAGEITSGITRHPLSADARALGAAVPLAVSGGPVEGFGVIEREGRTFLVALQAGRVSTHVALDGTSFTPVGAISADGLDADALGAPDLFVQRDTYRVVLPIRRGTRWRSALFASDDFVHWRLIDADVAATQDADERLGIREADALVEVGRESWIYEGYDGIGSSLRRRTRATP
jgi:hypothetical protein